MAPSASPLAFPVYPRVCGGTPPQRHGERYSAGLSPRVRGNRNHNQLAGLGMRSIPACAGEPACTAVTGRRRPVYPRVCGGTRPGRPGTGGGPGLSPRVRGNRQPGNPRPGAGGSIPACAGEPESRSSSGSWATVYPRVCGGTAVQDFPDLAVTGLSPRVRGNHHLGQGRAGRGGSIPACAGEPRTPWRRKRWARVYPRVCGGTRAPRDPGYDLLGLSPRVRGNLLAVNPGVVAAGSIPACAGEPFPLPLVGLPFAGSIPACAGEPLALLITPPAILFAWRIRETQ